MKIYLIKIPPFGYNSGELFTIGKCYDVELSPTMYDPQTLVPSPPVYIVKCNDNNWRKVDTVYFITKEEWREQQINKII